MCWLLIKMHVTTYTSFLFINWWTRVVRLSGMFLVSGSQLDRHGYSIISWLYISRNQVSFVSMGCVRDELVDHVRMPMQFYWTSGCLR